MDDDLTEILSEIAESSDDPDERNYLLAYNAIEKRDWIALKRMIRDGYMENFEHYDYKDLPLMFDVLEAGATDVACFWLKRGYPANFSWGRSNKAIAHWAATLKQPEVLRTLLKLGANVFKENDDDETPLFLAAKSGCLECAKILLKAGADPNGLSRDSALPEEYGNTPLAAAKTDSIAEALIQAGADPDRPVPARYFDIPDKAKKFFEDENLAPLSTAILEGRNRVAYFFLERAADPNLLNGQPMRCYAVAKDAGWIFRDLIESGADVNGVPGAEPLRLAATLGNLEQCENLLKEGAEPVADALNLAVKSGNLQCVRLFLKKGIGDPRDAIREAAKRGSEEILYYLLGRYPELGREAALHGAIEGCDLSLARELLEQGADPNARDFRGMTPLAKLYSLDRRKETFRYKRVLNKKSGEKWRDRDNWPTDEEIDEHDSGNFFHFNLSRPDNWNEILKQFDADALEFAKELIARGANIEARDKDGRSVLWHICRKMWMESALWFIEMGASLDARDRDGVSAFEAGCLSGESFIIEPMLKFGYDPNTRDANGDTALLKCARDERRDAKCDSSIFWLVVFGADPDLENNKGESLRKLARTNKSLALILKFAEDRRAERGN